MASEASGGAGKGMELCSLESVAELGLLFQELGHWRHFRWPLPRWDLCSFRDLDDFLLLPLRQVTGNYSRSVHCHITIVKTTFRSTVTDLLLGQ